MSESVQLPNVPESVETKNYFKQTSDKLNVGAQLSLARTQQNLSIEQITNQLKWSSRQIAEIEAGNYAALHDFSSLRGFIRSYAKILKIDSESLIEELSIEFAKLPTKVVDRPLLDTPFPTGRTSRIGKHDSRLLRIFGGIFLCLGVIYAVFVYRAEIGALIGNATQVNANVVVGHSTTAEVKPETLTKSALYDQDNTSRVAMENRTMPVSIPAIVKIPVSFKKSENTSYYGQQNKHENVSDMVSSSDLVLSFEQDSWIQIKHVDGSIVISHLYKAGTEETMSVTEPFNLIIGNAPGVRATLRGKRLAFQARNGSNVVNLNIR